MEFMDKVRAAAQDVAVEAKRATAQAQGKVEEFQLRRKRNEAAKKLGYLVYAERTRAEPAGAEGDRLVAEMATLDEEIAAHAAQQRAAREAAEPPPPPPADRPAPGPEDPTPPPTTPAP